MQKKHYRILLNTRKNRPAEETAKALKEMGHDVFIHDELPSTEAIHDILNGGIHILILSTAETDVSYESVASYDATGPCTQTASSAALIASQLEQHNIRLWELVNQVLPFMDQTFDSYASACQAVREEKDARSRALNSNLDVTLIPPPPILPMKRIVYLTNPQNSIRLTEVSGDYGIPMANAANHMMMKVLFNTLREKDYTFRCFAWNPDLPGMTPWKYILRNQSYLPADPPHHSDENRLVIRDNMLNELPW